MKYVTEIAGLTENRGEEVEDDLAGFANLEQEVHDVMHIFLEAQRETYWTHSIFHRTILH